MIPDENKCGTCTACCRVYAIPELSKPAGDWCRHCDVGKGCKIYPDRPAPRCTDFKCLWLESQDTIKLPLELRPDKCKVVFIMSTNPRVSTATTLPGYPDALQRPAVRELIDLMLLRGLSVAIGEPDAQTQLLLSPNGSQRLVEMTEPDEDGMRWSKS